MPAFTLTVITRRPLTSALALAQMRFYIENTVHINAPQEIAYVCLLAMYQLA